MTNDDVNRAMGAHLRHHGLPPLPKGEIDRDGRRVDLSGVTWRCNVATAHIAINWSRLEVGNVIVSYALRRWAIMLMTQKSGATVWRAVKTTASALAGRAIRKSKNRLVTSGQSLAGTRRHLPSLASLPGIVCGRQKCDSNAARVETT